MAAAAGDSASANAEFVSQRRASATQINPGEISRPMNLQRIAQRKTQVRNYPKTKKLEKLGVYSSCKADDSCKCNGWKNPNPPPTPTQPSRLDIATPLASLSDPCRSCSHQLAAHVSHLENVPDEEINRLLGIVVDVENLFLCVHKEEDADTKQVYFYLFKLLRKCILQMSKPSVEGPLGSPPFEKPSINKGVTNFVVYKFGHLPQKDWQTMYDLAKMFLHCLNHWKLETPTVRKQRAQTDDVAAYKVNYTRWEPAGASLFLSYGVHSLQLLAEGRHPGQGIIGYGVDGFDAAGDKPQWAVIHDVLDGLVWMSTVTSRTLCHPPLMQMMGYSCMEGADSVQG